MYRCRLRRWTDDGDDRVQGMILIVILVGFGCDFGCDVNRFGFRLVLVLFVCRFHTIQYSTIQHLLTP